MREWLSVACQRDVVRRALGVALVVGAILVALNHGPALLKGDVSAGRLAQIVLTILVPYCVSTASSVGAIRASGTTRGAHIGTGITHKG